MRTLLVMLIGSFIPICFADDHREYDSLIEQSSPQVGETNEVYLGDLMLTSTFGEWKKCITPIKNFEASMMTSKFRVLANHPICKEKKKHKRYKPDYVNFAVSGNYVSADKNPYSISLVSWKAKGEKSRLCATRMGVNGVCVKNISESEVSEGEVLVPNANSFVKSIEYAGKQGSVLRFVYSEWRDETDPLTLNKEKIENSNREFEIDLDEGNIVAYRGALLEVLSSTGASIEYKIIRSFKS